MPYSQRSVFGANWIYVGRTAQCSEPGQYFSGNVGREPFIVARSFTNAISMAFSTLNGVIHYLGITKEN